MAELATVYETSPDDVSRVVHYLNHRNLNPIVLDDIERMGPYRDQAQKVRIAVPQTERQRALSILAEMEQREQARLAPHLKVAGGAMAIFLGAGGFVAIVGILDRGGKWFVILWLVLTVVAAVALIRWAWRKHPDRR